MGYSHFHDECLVHYDGPQGKVHYAQETLKTHLHTNGHSKPGDQLLLKLDVEGAEWEVLSRADPADLRQFRQIVAELHEPYVNGVMDRQRFDQRVATMQKMLE